MKNIVILVLVALTFTACATKNEVAIVNEKTTKVTEKVDDLAFEIKDKSLKIQEVTTKIATLELENKQNSKEYISLKQELYSLYQEISSLSQRFDKIEKDGKDNASQISELRKILNDYSKKHREWIVKYWEDSKKLEEKYINGESK